MIRINDIYPCKLQVTGNNIAIETIDDGLSRTD